MPTATDTPTPVPTDTPGGPPTDTPAPTDVPDTATITICKDTNPENDDGKTFDFDTDIPGMLDPDLEDDECDTQTGVAPDDYEIKEIPDLMPDGWELDEIDCDGIPASRWDDDLGRNSVQLMLEAGDDVVCTFTNIDVDAFTPSISICKDTNPETEGKEFDFESDDLDDFSLEDDDCEEVTEPNAGEYVITEREVPGWNLTEIDCTGTDDGNIDVDLADNRVTVDLEEGEDVECTFTNTLLMPGNTIGDVNKNGVVDAIDAQLILQAVAGLIIIVNPQNADTNLDGIVNPVDATLILQFVAGLIPSLPSILFIPTPAAGAVVETPTPTPEHTIGDVNKNGVVNAIDAQLILQSRAGSSRLGDANCDANVDSIDALFILQLTAGLIDRLPCPQNADANGDGTTNSVDAALVLQHSAGIHTLITVPIQFLPTPRE